jgi:hypothetical protein
MNNTGFVVDGAPIKDMTDEALKKAAQKISSELQAVGVQLSACMQQVQISTAMLNVVNYEIDRRAHSIQIATTIPH